jgi:hypothetical protein
VGQDGLARDRRASLLAPPLRAPGHTAFLTDFEPSLVQSEHSREIRDAIFAGPDEVLESTTKGADLLESKPVGPSARWA